MMACLSWGIRVRLNCTPIPQCRLEGLYLRRRKKAYYAFQIEYFFEIPDNSAEHSHTLPIVGQGWQAVAQNSQGPHKTNAQNHHDPHPRHLRTSRVFRPECRHTDAAVLPELRSVTLVSRKIQRSIIMDSRLPAKAGEQSKQNYKGTLNPMRKIIMILTLAISGLAVSSALNAGIPTPPCYPNCAVAR
jgi:hypothetical protein